MTPFSKAVEKVRTQVKWWAYAAWSLPLIALALLGAEQFFDYHDLFRKTLVAIGIVFFSVSVYWWWWAIYKIREIVEGFDRTAESLIDVKEEIITTRKVIEDSSSWENVDTRKRGE
jgi:hypothetical protein